MFELIDFFVLGQDNVIVKRVNGAHLRLYKMPVEGSSSSLSNSIPSNPSHSSSTCSLQLTPINSNSSPYSPQTPPINLSQQTNKQDGKGRHDKRRHDKRSLSLILLHYSALYQ